MTAQPVEDHVMWSPDTRTQLRAGYTVEDIILLPDDAPRVELRDGVMNVVPSPTIGHQNIGNLLWMWLRSNAPEDFNPVTAIGIALSLNTTFEPDVLLLQGSLVLSRHFVLPHQVAIAVEVVSPGTKKQDRMQKPVLYAAAGIRHYWRIEQNPLHVFAYDLVEDHYELVADSAERLSLTLPFPIELDIRDITP